MESDSRWLQASVEDCFCPVDSPDLRAPSEDEFELVYNELIQFLRAEGKVTTITSVDEVRDRGNTIAPTLGPTLLPSQSPTSISPTSKPAALAVAIISPGARFANQEFNIAVTVRNIGTLTAASVI
jgi:hypothetical protein